MTEIRTDRPYDLSLLEITKDLVSLEMRVGEMFLRTKDETLFMVKNHLDIASALILLREPETITQGDTP